MFSRKVVGLFVGTGAVGAFAYHRWKKQGARKLSFVKPFTLDQAILIGFSEQQQQQGNMKELGIENSDIKESQFNVYNQEQGKEQGKEQVLNLFLENGNMGELSEGESTVKEEELVWDEKTMDLITKEFPQALEYAHKIIELEGRIEDTHRRINMVKEKKREIQEECKDRIENTIMDQSHLLSEYKGKVDEERDTQINTFVVTYLLRILLIDWNYKLINNNSDMARKGLQNHFLQTETEFQQKVDTAKQEYEEKVKGLCSEAQSTFTSIFPDPSISADHFQSLHDLAQKSSNDIKKSKEELENLQRIVILQMKLQNLLDHPGRSFFPKSLVEEIHSVLQYDPLKKLLRNNQEELYSVANLKVELRKLTNQNVVSITPDSTMISQSLSHLQKCLSNPPEFIAVGNQKEDILDRTCYFLEKRSSLAHAMKEIESLPPPLQITLADWKHKVEDRLALEYTRYSSLCQRC